MQYLKLVKKNAQFIGQKLKRVPPLPRLPICKQHLLHPMQSSLSCFEVESRQAFSEFNGRVGFTFKWILDV